MLLVVRTPQAYCALTEAQFALVSGRIAPGYGDGPCLMRIGSLGLSLRPRVQASLAVGSDCRPRGTGPRPSGRREPSWGGWRLLALENQGRSSCREINSWEADDASVFDGGEAGGGADGPICIFRLTQPDPVDRRARTVQLTPRGDELRTSARNDIRAMEDGLLSKLSVAEQNTLRSVLPKLAGPPR